MNCIYFPLLLPMKVNARNSLAVLCVLGVLIGVGGCLVKGGLQSEVHESDRVKSGIKKVPGSTAPVLQSNCASTGECGLRMLLPCRDPRV